MQDDKGEDIFAHRFEKSFVARVWKNVNNVLTVAWTYHTDFVITTTNAWVGEGEGEGEKEKNISTFSQVYIYIFLNKKRGLIFEDISYRNLQNCKRGVIGLRHAIHT